MMVQMMPRHATADKSPRREEARGRPCRTLTTLLVAIVAIAPMAAFGHAIVIAATPAVNARIAPGPLRIRLQMNSRIDLERSRLTLYAPDGSGRPVVLLRDEAAGVLGGTATVTTVGRWKLHWQVLSVDGHITRGEIPFVVGEGKSDP
jgi:methionine-rich copper-binding protein CopC